MMTKCVLAVSLGAAHIGGCMTLGGDSYEDYKFDAPRRAETGADGVTQVKIIARAGSLEVLGQEGLAEVSVDGTAKAAEQEVLDQIELEVTRTGDEVLVKAILPEDQGTWTARGLDLVVEVPAGVEVEIHDSSGSISLSSVAGAVIHDGSGKVVVHDLSGDLTVHDGSGSIEVHNVDGSVVLEDGSGSIDIHGAGSVEIREDGSGSIEIEDVQGNVEIGVDGSGSIEAGNIGGDFTVHKDGSGSIEARGVRGEVHLP